MIRQLGHETCEVRTPEQLNSIEALIIPGGESTTFLKLFALSGLSGYIRDFAKNKPVMGTCAGLIVLAKAANDLPSEPLNLIDIDVERNSYGRQKESFIDDLIIQISSGQREKFTGIFIRAPRILRIGDKVRVCGWHGKDIVMAEQGNILVCTFHPELTNDPAIHKYFIDSHL